MKTERSEVLEASNDCKRAISYLKVKLPTSVPITMTVTHEETPVLRDLGNGLLVSYLVDRGEGFSYIQNRDLLAAGIDEEKLHKIGIDNLYALAAKHLQIQQHGPIFALFMEGNFEASVLLLDKVWDVSLAEHIDNEFIAALPTRDILAFGDSGSPEAITELRALIGRLEDGDHPLSSSLYRRTNRTWRQFSVT